MPNVNLAGKRREELLGALKARFEKNMNRQNELGGAIFCDRRYDTVFLYHNGAESYYAARAFRGSLRV